MVDHDLGRRLDWMSSGGPFLPPRIPRCCDLSKQCLLYCLSQWAKLQCNCISSTLLALDTWDEPHANLLLFLLTLHISLKLFPLQVWKGKNRNTCFQQRWRCAILTLERGRFTVETEGAMLGGKKNQKNTETERLYQFNIFHLLLVVHV